MIQNEAQQTDWEFSSMQTVFVNWDSFQAKLNTEQLLRGIEVQEKKNY